MKDYQKTHLPECTCKKKEKKMTKLIQTTAGDDKVVKLTNSSWYSLIIGLTQSLRQFLRTTLEGISWFMMFMMQNERHYISSFFSCNRKLINSNLTSNVWHKQGKLRTVKQLYQLMKYLHQQCYQLSPMMQKINLDNNPIRLHEKVYRFNRDVTVMYYLFKRNMVYQIHKEK